jgi:hypothetical protein
VLAAIKERHAQQLAGDPINRANNLARRADNLKKLADAWQPLYQNLNPDQKRRARLLSMDMFCDMFRDLRDAAIVRRIERFERFGQTG